MGNSPMDPSYGFVCDMSKNKELQVFASWVCNTLLVSIEFPFDAKTYEQYLPQIEQELRGFFAAHVKS